MTNVKSPKLQGCFIPLRYSRRKLIKQADLTLAEVKVTDARAGLGQLV
jgi:hypothetical protein